MLRYGRNFEISNELMNTIATYMLDDEREQVHCELAPCTHEEFLKRYLQFDPNFEQVLYNEFGIENRKESNMKNVKIIMWCFLNKEDIEKIFDNFSDSYPEVEVEESYYDQSLEDGTLEFTWEGIIGERSVDDIIRLTHHAEGIYEDTSAEYVHVEVCIDGKWYGRM